MTGGGGEEEGGEEEGGEGLVLENSRSWIRSIIFIHRIIRKRESTQQIELLAVNVGISSGGWKRVSTEKPISRPAQVSSST